MAAIPVVLDPQQYYNHHHLNHTVKKKKFYMKSPEIPIHDETLESLEKEYLYMSNQPE
jgi:hypothetical protein